MTKLSDLRRVECSCGICASWCNHVPGWFTPGEMEKAAKVKGMKPLEFFRRYVTVDYWCGDTVFTLRPRTTQEAGGDVAAYDPRGRCVFFKNGKCEIHAAKPHECATSRHDVTLPKDWHETTAKAWRAKRAVRSIEKYLGRTPEEPEHDMGDILGWMFGRWGV